MDNKVIIYSTTWCGFCAAEKDWLEHNGEKFESKEIDLDETAKQEFFGKIGGEQNFRGVPVTDVNGELVLGFDRNKLAQLLKIKRF